MGNSPGVRPLVITRLMNTLLNSFAFGSRTDNWQKRAYVRGGHMAIPQLDGCPCWVYTEFNTLGASATGRTRMALPDGFVLLGYFGSASVNTVGGFRVNVYDFDRRMRMIERPVNFQALCGNGSSPLFQGGQIGSRQATPYSFAETTPQAAITVVNLETAANLIVFGFYGLQGSSGQEQS